MYQQGMRGSAGMPSDLRCPQDDEVSGGDEPGWGATAGLFDGAVVRDADADADAEPGWGATGGDVMAPAVGPVFDLLDHLGDGVVQLQELLADQSCVVLADLPEAAVRLHALAVRVQAAHMATVGQVIAAGAIPPGSATANAWLADSHHLDADRSGRIRKNAVWLAEHPATAAALAGGSITLDHVTAIRVVADANGHRREAFAEFEPLVVEAAALADPRHVGRIMAIWAENVDPDTADDDADAAYSRRRVHLSEVGEGWSLRGWLPGVIGAELAGILNAFMDQSWRRANGASDGADVADGAADHDGPADPRPAEAGSPEDDLPASVRRADALMDAVRAAAQAGLTPGVRSRSAVTVTVPIGRLHTCRACGGHHHGPDQPCDGPGSRWYTGAVTGLDLLDAAGTRAAATWAAATWAAATWAVGNGPGTAHLPSALAAWACCDGEITRLVLDAKSRPLDLGRSQRVVPAALRRALDVRDGGCVIPGCDRPPGWCEAHHVQHWADGGSTAIHNLALICSKHHHELHLGHWHLVMRHDLPVATHIPRHERPHHRRRHRQPQAA